MKGSVPALLLIVANAWAQETTTQRSNSSSDAAVSEVVVNRKGCYGTCPIYSLTLRRDGDSAYIERREPHQGIYSARRLSIRDFDRLTIMISDLNFFDLPDVIGPAGEDAERVAVTVTTPSGTKTVETFYFQKAPPAFRDVVRLADRFWQEVYRGENLKQPTRDSVSVPVR